MDEAQKKGVAVKLMFIACCTPLCIFILIFAMLPSLLFGGWNNTEALNDEDYIKNEYVKISDSLNEAFYDEMSAVKKTIKKDFKKKQSLLGKSAKKNITVASENINVCRYAAYYSQWAENKIKIEGRSAVSMEEFIKKVKKAKLLEVKTTVKKGEAIYVKYEICYRGDDVFAKYLELTDKEIEYCNSQEDAVKLFIGEGVSTNISLQSIYESMDDDTGSGGYGTGKAKGVSKLCEKRRKIVRKYCKKYKIPQYEDAVLALMMIESGGSEPDPMQAAEGSDGYCIKTKTDTHSISPNGFSTGHAECSIRAGVLELKKNLNATHCKGPADIRNLQIAIQGYNFGSAWIPWIQKHGNKYSVKKASEYSSMIQQRLGLRSYGTPTHAKKFMKYYSANSVVYYNQTDEDWAGHSYGKNHIGAAGCCPTSMAICISTLTGKKVTPIMVADWMAGKGYYVYGSGTMHAAVPAAAKHWKLKSKGLGKSKTEVQKALKSGKLVVAIMAKGDFTSGGHYIVLSGITKKGRIQVADCGSRARTKKTWSLDLIINQSRNGADAGGPFWAISN